MKSDHEPLVAKLRNIAGTRNQIAFDDHVRTITRREIDEILAVLDPPLDPLDRCFRDAHGDKIGINDHVEFVGDDDEFAGRYGVTVGLSNAADEDVVIVRFSHETRVRTAKPNTLLLASAER